MVLLINRRRSSTRSTKCSASSTRRRSLDNFQEIILQRTLPQRSSRQQSLRQSHRIMERMFVFVLSIVLIHGGFTTPQNSNPIDSLEDAATAAQSGDTAAVRTLTDAPTNELPMRF